MKTIGIIGGMSWKSSLEYYKILNELIHKKLGGFHSCKCIMYSFDFDEIESLQAKGEWDKIAEKMIEAGKILENAGADVLMIASNTIYKVGKQIQGAISIPLLHIVDAAGKEISRLGLRRIGLLGTSFTMEEDFYKDILLKRYNIKTIVPPDSERELLQHIIFRELVAGITNEISRRRVIRIMNNLMVRGAEGIILGCTELPLLISEKDTNNLLFNSTFLHVKDAVNLVLDESDC